VYVPQAFPRAIVIPYLDEAALENRAEKFLFQYMPKRVVPVPIEVIFECDLKMELFPISGFESRFNIVGYISNDLKTLAVDADVVKNNPSRLRFTIAHEISHKVLHGDFILQAFPGNERDWKERLLHLDRKLYRKLEAQANIMAGMLLVPRTELTVLWHEMLQSFSRQGVEVEEIDEYTISRLVSKIAGEFQVSGITVSIALKQYKMR
jgi:hypothetical protein